MMLLFSHFQKDFKENNLKKAFKNTYTFKKVCDWNEIFRLLNIVKSRNYRFVHILNMLRYIGVKFLSEHQHS